MNNYESKKVRILYVTRKDAKTVFGGDLVQLTHTKSFIEEKNNIIIDVKPQDEVLEQDFKNTDIVHFWGVFTCDLSLLELAKKNNVKIVISSIFWDFTDSILINYFYSFIYAFPQFLINIIRFFTISFSKYVLYNIAPQFRKRKDTLFLSRQSAKIREKQLSYASAVIPNSYEEKNLLKKYSNKSNSLPDSLFFEVPNAVDIEYIQNHKDTGFLSHIKDFVIESAGIEPLKNQLGLLNALYKNPEIPIVFAGDIRDEQYYTKLKNIADKRGNVYFTGKIPPDDLFSLYKRAKVHALPSFRESPGLSTLESLLCGAQIVVSTQQYCPITYYKFDKYGFVCNPYSEKSIRIAVLKAFKNPKNINLPKEYINFFSYENVANMISEVYINIVEGK